jgi:hypothetical protein
MTKEEGQEGEQILCHKRGVDEKANAVQGRRKVERTKARTAVSTSHSRRASRRGGRFRRANKARQANGLKDLVRLFSVSSRRADKADGVKKHMT